MVQNIFIFSTFRVKNVQVEVGDVQKRVKLCPHSLFFYCNGGDTMQYHGGLRSRGEHVQLGNSAD